MASDAVGGLYLAVGIDGDAALREARQLHEEMARIARQITEIGKGASLKPLANQLAQVQQQAKAAAVSAAGGGQSGSNDLQRMLADQRRALADIQAQRAAASKAAADATALENRVTIESIAQQAVARQRAAQEAAAAQARLSQMTMADLQREIAATSRAADAQVKAAQRTAQEGIAASNRTTNVIEQNRLREVRAAEQAARREAAAAKKAAQEAARARRAALPTLAALGASAQELFVGLGAARSGNYFYGLAAGARYAKNLTAAFAGMGAAASAAAGAVGLVTVAVAAVGTAVAYAGVKIIELGETTAAGFEMLKIQLSGLLGSVKRGADEMRFLLDLGKESLVPTDSLIQADRMLLAFGVTANKTRREVVQFMSDFATATGASQEAVYFLSLALGQVASAGKANSVDMRQLANAYISLPRLYKIIGREIGMSAQEVSAKVKEGIVTSDVLFRALDKYGVKFQKTADAARKSTIGLIGNIKDTVTTNLGVAFETVNKRVAAVLQGIMDILPRINFAGIAAAVNNSLSMIGAQFGSAKTSGDALVNFLNFQLPEAINFVGGAVAETVHQFKLWWTVAQTVGAAIQTSYYLVAHAVLEVAVAAYDAMNGLTLGIGGVVDSATVGIRDKMNEAQVSIDTAGAAALDRMVKLNDEVNALWNEASYKPLLYNVGRIPIGPVMDGWAAKYQKPAAVTGGAPLPTSLPTGGGGGGGGAKTDPVLERLKKWLDAVKDLVSKASDASKTLYDDLRRPFAKLRPTVQSELQQAFTSGDAETVITQFEKTRDAIREMFAPLESKELNTSASSRKAAVRLRKQYIAELRKSTGELVKLAEADRVAQATFDEIEKQVTAAQADIEKRRTALAAQYAAQQKVITRQFDSYYEATSATQGRFVKGAIDTAQAALDAATTAYEAARDKLDELKAARDDYLSSLADTVRSYVNDLANVTKEIERYTRLDNVGSFSMVTESQASVASFKASLTERLEALKKWRTDVATLMAGGLDSTLLKDLVAQGPEATKDLVGSLAGASSDEIAQINALQSQLSEQITGMQKEASAKWFDAGIAAQEAFTAPLKAAMDAAQAQVDALNQQKDLALGVLEAWNAEQTELLDAQQAEQDARLATAQATLNATLEANKAKATTIANAIQKTLGTLPGHAVAMGIDTIQGLIDGLESKKPELLAAARKIAEEVRSTIASALDIHSPPPWAIEMGGDISTGLAMGMEGSLDRIAVASDAMAAAAVPSVNAASPSALTFAPGITVKIGDRELIDIVDVQIEQRDAESLSYVLAGRRR